MSITVFRLGLAIAKTVADQAYGSAPGRWHSLRTGAVARRAIYCAGTRALARLDKRVHASGIAPIGQALYRLELPDELVAPTAEAAGLPGSWRNPEAVTRAFGDRWLDTRADLALWVPSYVEPAEYNLLINAVHPRLPEVTLVKARTAQCRMPSTGLQADRRIDEWRTGQGLHPGFRLAALPVAPENRRPRSQ